VSSDFKWKFEAKGGCTEFRRRTEDADEPVALRGVDDEVVERSFALDVKSYCQEGKGGDRRASDPRVRIRKAADSSWRKGPLCATR
jgi:hypothetical protein